MGMGMKKSVKNLAAMNEDPVHVRQAGKNNPPLEFFPPQVEKGNRRHHQERMVAHPNRTVEIRLGRVIRQVGELVQKPVREERDDRRQAQSQLGNALSRLLVVSENYPDLKANQNFIDLQAQLEGTENRITTARNYFNQAAQAYNTAVQSFPSNFVAGISGFTTRPYFQAKEGSDVPPPVHFDFNSPTNAAPAQ